MSRRAARASCCAWAERARTRSIIEDDYDAEYRYDRAPVGALQGLRPDLVAPRRVGLEDARARAAAGLADRAAAWRERLLAGARGLDHGLPALEQLALADFIERGAYDRHLRRSGRAYRRRRDALLEALARRAARRDA